MLIHSFVMLAAGCSPSSFKGLDSTNGAVPTASGTTSGGAADTGDGSSSTSAAEPPAYYAFQLTFEQLADDTWDPASIELSLRLFAADQTSLCSTTVPVTSVTVDPTPASEPAILEWWALALDAAAPTTGCPDWPARAWHVGVGEYDPRLDAALAAAGHAETAPYGLYFEEDPVGAAPAPIYSLGYIADDAILAGDTGVPAAEAPLQPGTYTAVTLLKMSVPAP